VVSGKTLPAGTYTVRPIGDEKLDGLILSSYENGTSVFVRAVEMERAYDDNPSVSFEHVGERHFLSTIQTPFEVYHCSVPLGDPGS
jgi:hypothetical protein